MGATQPNQRATYSVPDRAGRSRGRAVVVGFTGGSIPEVRVNRLLLNNTEVVAMEPPMAVLVSWDFTPAYGRKALELAPYLHDTHTNAGSVFGMRASRAGSRSTVKP